MVYVCLIAFACFILIGDAALDRFWSESASLARELVFFVVFLLTSLGAFCALLVLASSLLGAF